MKTGAKRGGIHRISSSPQREPGRVAYSGSRKGIEKKKNFLLPKGPGVFWERKEKNATRGKMNERSKRVFLPFHTYFRNVGKVSLRTAKGKLICFRRQVWEEPFEGTEKLKEKQGHIALSIPFHRVLRKA